MRKISFDVYNQDGLVCMYEGYGNDDELFLKLSLEREDATRVVVYLQDSKGKGHCFWVYPREKRIRKIY